MEVSSGLEPELPASKAWCDNRLHHETIILGLGFEPRKHYAPDLKSDPFDQTRVTQLLGGGFEPPKHNAPDLKSGPFNQTRES